MTARIIPADSSAAASAEPLFAMRTDAVLSPYVADKLAIAAHIEAQARQRYADAHERGLRAGIAEVAARCVSLIEAAEDAAEQGLAGSEHQIIEVGLAVARRILLAEAAVAPSSVAAMVEDHRRRLGPSKVACHAGSEMYALLEAHWNEDRHATELVESPDAPPWSMVLTGRAGTIDAGFERQLGAIAEQLFSRVRQRKQE